jgi:hypothetical protein
MVLTTFVLSRSAIEFREFSWRKCTASSPSHAQNLQKFAILNVVRLKNDIIRDVETHKGQRWCIIEKRIAGQYEIRLLPYVFESREDAEKKIEELKAENVDQHYAFGVGTFFDFDTI